MAKLPRISSRRFEKFLIRVGCEYVRQKGSHRVYWRSGLLRPIIVPRCKTLPQLVVKNNLRILGISNEEFQELLKG